MMVQKNIASCLQEIVWCKKIEKNIKKELKISNL